MPGPDRSSYSAPRDGMLPRNKRRRTKRAKPAAAPPPNAPVQNDPDISALRSKALLIELPDASLRILPPTGPAPTAEPPAEAAAAPLPPQPDSDPEAAPSEPAPEHCDTSAAIETERPEPAAAMPDVSAWEPPSALVEQPTSDETPLRPVDIPAPEQDAVDAATALGPVAVPSAEPSPAELPVATAAPRPSPTATGRGRPRRLALVASVAAASVSAIVWFALPETEATPVGLFTSLGASGNPAASPRLRLVAADVLAPSEAATLVPQLATAAYGTDDLVAAAVLPPTAKERVVARSGTRADLVAPTPGRKPALKLPTATAAAQPRPAASDGERRERSRGVILDFLSGVLSD